MIKLADVTPNHDKFPFVYADTETTGVDKYSEIIEISCTEYNLRGEVGATISYMCEPVSGHIPDGASKVNGIYMKDVIGKPSYILGGVRMDVAEFIGDRQLVAHNAQFDVRMMRIKFREGQVECTLKKAKKKWPDGKHNLRACINKIPGETWDNALAHRASYDVEKGIVLHVYLDGEKNMSDSEKLSFL